MLDVPGDAGDDAGDDDDCDRRMPAPQHSGDEGERAEREPLGQFDQGAAVTFVLDAGGRVAMHQPPDRDVDRLRLMLDPAGNPFCSSQE
ncbi:MAG: hypothetical protein KDB21_11020 [Acidimicrobiales bacterium]|nr:hypothetical protein [Acidimicrobiales bacterium]